MTKQGETRARVFEFLRHFTREEGRSPTVREIGRALGLRSSETVHRHLVALEHEGKIRRRRTPTEYVVEILDEEEPWLARPQSVAVPLLGRVAAGTPTLAAEHLEGSTPSQGVRRRRPGVHAPGLWRQHDRAGIFDGDYVIARKQTARNARWSCPGGGRGSHGELTSTEADGFAWSRPTATCGRSSRECRSSAGSPVFAACRPGHSVGLPR